MFNGIVKTIGQSVIQDLCVSAGAVLTAHGFLASSQSQEFEGSAFFLAMLAFNAVLQHLQTATPEASQSSTASTNPKGPTS